MNSLTKVSKLLVILGPTASGKTEVAYEMAKLLPVEMISCDSMQVYRSMPILTQAPSEKVLRALNAHQVSFLDPREEYSAAGFRSDAVSAIRKILKKQKTPLIVGGTGLYFRGLFDGLFEPEKKGSLKDELLREQLFGEEQKQGRGHLHQKLAAVDPVSAEKIHPGDLRRIVRALEVFDLTGKPLSLQKSNRRGIREDYPHGVFLLDRNRHDLYERINARVERMFEQGVVEEVQEVLKKPLGKTAKVALGIREIGLYLEGKCSLAQAKELLKKNTRHYAKRQISWFRHERGLVPMTVAPDEPPRETARRIVEEWKGGVNPALPSASFCREGRAG